MARQSIMIAPHLANYKVARRGAGVTDRRRFKRRELLLWPEAADSRLPIFGEACVAVLPMMAAKMTVRDSAALAMVFTPQGFHSAAQGRGRAPWVGSRQLQTRTTK